MQTLSRKDIIKESIENFGAIIVCENMAEAVDFANELAPEHLEVCCENPLEYEEKSARDPVTKATVSDIIKNIRDR